MAVLGVAAGVALGTWFGQGLSHVYTETTFRFPYLDYRLSPGDRADRVGGGGAGGGERHAAFGRARGAAAAGRGHAPGDAGDLPHHAGRAHRPAALVRRADADDPAPHRAAPAEVAADGARHRLRLRADDGGQLPEGRDRLHGRRAVPPGLARGPGARLHRSDLGPRAARTRRAAGRRLRRRLSRRAGDPALRAVPLSRRAVRHPAGRPAASLARPPAAAGGGAAGRRGADRPSGQRTSCM